MSGMITVNIHPYSIHVYRNTYSNEMLFSSNRTWVIYIYRLYIHVALLYQCWFNIICRKLFISPLGLTWFWFSTLFQRLAKLIMGFNSIKWVCTWSAVCLKNFCYPYIILPNHYFVIHRCIYMDFVVLYNWTKHKNLSFSGSPFVCQSFYIHF